ncbi:hypothetical protein BGZ79_001205 [Entomortierella chlamydospora]|nr:hypothetical protein BGZ79_001205 [Entomortierella chlamydospora]
MSAYKEDSPMVTEVILTQVGGLGGIRNSVTGPRHKVAEKMAHMDEAEALSECNGGMDDLGLNTNEPASVNSKLDFSDIDLMSLENLMMMDGNTSTDLAMIGDISDDDQHRNSGLLTQFNRDTEISLVAPVSKAYTRIAPARS